jgi:hypothetical protein
MLKYSTGQWLPLGMHPFFLRSCNLKKMEGVQPREQT